MLTVKHFVCGTTRSALIYLDNEINGWIKEEKITDVKEIRECFGQAPTGMSGSSENVLFLSVWYQVPD
ncbi:MAG: hypothetical protein ABIK20_01585 [Candidatus Omnitrophota bacterium]|nr:hypothetical protein [Candidatus Omnitrophota bacterium]